MKDANTLLYQIEETEDDIGLEIASDKTEYVRLNSNSDDGNMKSNNCNIIKQVENFKYLGSFIRSTEKDIEIRIAKYWSALNSMRTIWKSKMSDNLKISFFRATVECVLVYSP